MKKSISCILALLLVLFCAVSCKVIEEPGKKAETDPLTYWNTYIMKDPPKPFTYFACLWNYSALSSRLEPISTNPEVIAEVLQRLRTLSVTKEQQIKFDLTADEDWGLAISHKWGPLELGWLNADLSTKSAPRLKIMLSGDMLVLYFSKDNYSCFRLDSDKTEFKASMVDYAEAHQDTP